MTLARATRPLFKRARTTLFLTLGTGLLNAPAFAEWQALPREAPAPKDNPTTPEKASLGKALFFDPRLSVDGTVSCFSCHNVTSGGDDQRPSSKGVEAQLGGRNAPTVWNAAFISSQFWDGRAASLEDQALGPITNPIEMGMPNIEEAVSRIRKIPGYEGMFQAAFGKSSLIDMSTLAKAIAAYERTLITPDSAYDRFVRGDQSALDASQKRGMESFAAVGCNACHSGPNFSGPQQAEGQRFLMKFPTFAQSEYVTRYELMDDAGRYESTGQESDRNLWRVPTLRNLVHTAPYMHNGQVKSLDEAVRVMASTQLNRELDEAQVWDIVAFLESLSGPFPEQTLPSLPPAAGDMLN